MDILEKVEKGIILIDRKKLIETVIRECFWDYDITHDDIEKIVLSNDNRLKMKLFSKIIANSHDKLKVLLLFSKMDLLYLFNNYIVSANHMNINVTILILRNIYFNENNKIRLLEWKKK